MVSHFSWNLALEPLDFSTEVNLWQEVCVCGSGYSEFQVMGQWYFTKAAVISVRRNWTWVKPTVKCRLLEDLPTYPRTINTADSAMLAKVMVCSWFLTEEDSKSSLLYINHFSDKDTQHPPFPNDCIMS